MRVFEHGDPDSLAVRTHPWHGSLADAGHRHHDFRREPALIRTELEDFRGWESYAATETFYRLVEWLNGAESKLETSDCAFSGPTANESAGHPMALQCSGRLVLLFRELPHNTDPVRVHGLVDRVARALTAADEGFEWGVFGATILPVRFATLPGSDSEQLGSQLMLSFWAWGDDEAQAMAHLDRTLTNLTSVLQANGT